MVERVIQNKTLCEILMSSDLSLGNEELQAAREILHAAEAASDVAIKKLNSALDASSGTNTAQLTETPPPAVPAPHAPPDKNLIKVVEALAGEPQEWVISAGMNKVTHCSGISLFKSGEVGADWGLYRGNLFERFKIRRLHHQIVISRIQYLTKKHVRHE